MKFNVYRSSDYNPQIKPCDRAYCEGDLWYVDICDLEDLKKFANEVQNKIIINSECNKIEIYDAYRE